MKKLFFTTCMLLVTFIFSGCLTTLYPIFTENDIVFKPALLGKWKTKTKDSTDNYIAITALGIENNTSLPGNISSIKNKGYLITALNKDGSAKTKFIAFLATIGDRLYFDYYPVETDDGKKIDAFYRQNTVKMHTPYKVDLFANGGFQLSQLKADYLTNLIKEKKIRIKHETDVDNGEVSTITASTAELQQYIIKYGNDPAAYESDKIIYSK